MKSTTLKILTVASGSAFLLNAAPAWAEGVAAGTSIENTAEASYEVDGGMETISSNTVTLKVDELIDVAVASLNSGPVAANEASSILSYSITNTGNGPEAYALSVNTAVAGNDFDPTVDGIAVDTDGDGVYTVGIDEILSSPEQTAEIAADETLTIFVLLSIPATAVDSDEAQIELLAEAVTGTGAPGDIFARQGENGGDAIIGLGGAVDDATGTLIVGITTVSLVKSAVVEDPFGGSSTVPGSVITYTIQANVAGSGSIDGFVVRDTIPVGTDYNTSTLSLDGNPLTDAADSDQGAASQAAGVSVTLGTVAGGTNHSISFDVTVD